jgi:hypothetical protein
MRKGIKLIGQFGVLFCITLTLMLVKSCDSNEVNNKPDDPPNPNKPYFAEYADYAFDTIPAITPCFRCVDTPDHLVLSDKGDLEAIRSQIDFNENYGCDSAQFVNAFDFSEHTYLVGMTTIHGCTNYISTKVKQHPNSDTLTMWIDYKLQTNPYGCPVIQDVIKVVELSGVKPDQPIHFYGKLDSARCER